MEMLRIADNMDIINKACRYTKKFYDIFGDGNINLYAVLNNETIGFVGVKDNKGYYVEVNDESCVFEFGFDDEYNLEYFVKNNDVYVMDEDAVCFQNKEGIIEELRCLQLEYTDEDSRDGRIMYTQLNQNNNTNIELHFAFHYCNNERIGHPYIYQNKIKLPTYVFLTDNNKHGINYFPGLGNKFHYYTLYDMSRQSVGANIFSKESEQYDDYIYRYFRVFCYNRNMELIDAWPLGGSKNKEDMISLLDKYGFNFAIPQKLVDVYNQDDHDYEFAKELVQSVKEIIDKKEEDKQSKLILRME